MAAVGIGLASFALAVAVDSLSLGLGAILVAAAFVRALLLRRRRWEEKTLRSELSNHYRLDLNRAPYVSMRLMREGNLIELDVAFVVGDGEALRIYGEALPCSLPRHLVRSVRYNRFTVSHRPQMEIDWNTGNGVRTLYLIPKGCATRLEANRMLESLRLAIEYGCRKDLPMRPYILPPAED